MALGNYNRGDVAKPCDAGLVRWCNWRVSLAEVGLPDVKWCPDWCRIDLRKLKELERGLDEMRRR